ncbi:hypothetical protein WOSG25_020260 [Weissella oryzae SG25]|uniref:Uncharacterized protein n=1 Tax=Weissella oryzae (strain DSM 25784 / JCM 18191 / LMG 30913 / SG25) TaxID=1329250 RepID=A0A069CYT6_WEIOS|nr:hypothetical protein [Weissella oryzae]GAK30231.1 hypothetical protein WOSG25_020260 [Weissella oryzae SG25]
MSDFISGLFGAVAGWVGSIVLAKIKIKPEMVNVTTESYQKVMNRLSQALEEQQDWLAERAELRAEIKQLNTTIEELKAQLAGFESLLIKKEGK